ncbi:MAG: type II toxin-antitoxin system HigB family toxin [Rhodospirillaceae bacterium]|nr:type II toxin-antitoxin system HigB family toxin [Rhodospirillaceae bacterium]
MRIIARRTLKMYVESRRRSKDRVALKTALDAWYAEVRKALWRSSADIKRSYGTASIVSSDRVVFNIKGNDYQLITAVDYRHRIVWIKWLGTHADYDKINARTVKHETP